MLLEGVDVEGREGLAAGLALAHLAPLDRHQPAPLLLRGRTLTQGLLLALPIALLTPRRLTRLGPRLVIALLVIPALGRGARLLSPPPLALALLALLTLLLTLLGPRALLALLQSLRLLRLGPRPPRGTAADVLPERGHVTLGERLPALVAPPPPTLESAARHLLRLLSSGPLTLPCSALLSRLRLGLLRLDGDDALGAPALAPLRPACFLRVLLIIILRLLLLRQCGTWEVSLGRLRRWLLGRELGRRWGVHRRCRRRNCFVHGNCLGHRAFRGFSSRRLTLPAAAGEITRHHEVKGTCSHVLAPH
eukprot:scaffold3977_cov56-Phaeocystis_antarctica.AAC.4